MPSSWTSSLRLNKQFTGENINLWGDLLNDQVFTPTDYAIAGWLTKAITGDYTLTTANGSADEARAAMLKFTGTLAANASITIPSVSKTYFVYNATDKVLTFTTGAGATVTVDAGDKTVIFCDGSAVHTITFGTYDLKTYITSMTASAGAVPGTTGHLGKFLKVTADGGPSTWQAITGADLSTWTANAAAVRTGTTVTLAMSPGETYDALEEVALTSSAGSVALDFGAMINGYHLLTEDTTLANPTNPKVGQSGWIRVEQHASSAKTCATGSNWYRVGGDLAVSTTLGSFNIYEYQVITPTYILYDLLRGPSNA